MPRTNPFRKKYLKKRNAEIIRMLESDPPPTYREAGAVFELSPQAIYNVVKKYERDRQSSGQTLE